METPPKRQPSSPSPPHSPRRGSFDPTNYGDTTPLSKKAQAERRAQAEKELFETRRFAREDVMAREKQLGLPRCTSQEELALEAMIE